MWVRELSITRRRTPQRQGKSPKPEGKRRTQPRARATPSCGIVHQASQASRTFCTLYLLDSSPHLVTQHESTMLRALSITGFFSVIPRRISERSGAGNLQSDCIARRRARHLSQFVIRSAEYVHLAGYCCPKTTKDQKERPLCIGNANARSRSTAGARHLNTASASGHTSGFWQLRQRGSLGLG